jgi:B12-binding domain/radical SAM domain protein
MNPGETVPGDLPMMTDGTPFWQAQREADGTGARDRLGRDASAEREGHDLPARREERAATSRRGREDEARQRAADLLLEPHPAAMMGGCGFAPSTAVAAPPRPGYDGLLTQSWSVWTRMPAYDLILIHPPAVYDFRFRPLFPGPMGRSPDVVQFNKVPIGMLSIAEYLDRHGYTVVVDNVCDRMIQDIAFDVEEHIRRLDAPIIGVGLNFQQHAPGALEIARLCKEAHPESLVVLGGLTATCFHEEIIEKYPFVDVVVRAEAEKPLLELVRAYEQEGGVGSTPNLTYRAEDGAVVVTPLMQASTDLDDFDFTRLDLLQPKTSVFIPDSANRWSLVVCRGCAYDCTICGGSAYSYRKNFGMPRPAFRSPRRIVDDIQRLVDQGVRFIGLYQDPRVAGQAYWEELRDLLIKETPQFERLSFDLLFPADEAFVRDVAGISRKVILHFCPDTGSDSVRHLLGRRYDNEQILATIKLCLKYRIPVTNFFSVGLAGEAEAEMHETWDLWAQLDALNQEALEKGDFHDIEENVAIGGQVMGPILIDPGSRAFDHPEACGYKLLYKNLEEYVEALSQPSWHQWLNYGTELLDKRTIVDMIQQSTDFVIDQREITGFFGTAEAHYERCRLEADRVIIEAIDETMNLPDPRQREARVIAIRRTLDNLEKTRMNLLGE